MLSNKENALCEKWPYSELFWSAFSHIRTEYGEIRRNSPYSVQMRENADQNNPSMDILYAVMVSVLSQEI